MRILGTWTLTAALLAVTIAPQPAAAQARPTRAASRTTLDIYFIDVEGGQSTLIVTPTGESLLIDTGFPGDGTFASLPGDPAKARDPQRILAAARSAGVSQIDYLMLTHYHADHAGGVIELAQLLPIRTFIDHAAPTADAEAGVPGTQAVYDRYVALRATGAHLEPAPGARLPLKGIDATVVSSAGAILSSALPGAGTDNPTCGGAGLPAQEKTENPRSTGIRLQYGRFRFLDVGDLSGAPLNRLVCPRRLVGETDVYLVAHHGGLDAADPAVFAGVTPRVAIVNNGPNKGGAKETLAVLSGLTGVDTWQLHRAVASGTANVADDRIANLDESTSAWIKLSAKADGSFTLTNGRTGVSKVYPARAATKRPAPR